MEWLKGHVLESVYAALIAGLTGAFGWLGKKIKAQKAEQDAIKGATKALLHDRIYHACQFYIKQGWCSIDDKENIEYMYRPYKKLGGNGTCERLFVQVQNLPIQERGR